MFPERFVANEPAPTELPPPLLRWFDRHRRDLPWRETRDPYRIWLSEIMLQQTQVVTVIPYYHRFLQAFPTVSALAAAPLDEVLRLWEGLGYYARARNLHRAAQAVVRQYDGNFPGTLPEARSLPGIGQYTAGAILSIAFGVPLPALDGNALRVLSRVFWLPGGGRQGEEKRKAERLGREAVPLKRPGDYNQALMELGATLCTPRTPNCPHCPLQGLCLGCARGEADSIPIIARAAGQSLDTVAGLVRRNSKVLLARRPPQGVWAGLWEYPNLPLGDGAAEPLLAAHLREEFGLAVEVGEPLMSLVHGLMNRRLRLTAYDCRAIGGRLRCRLHVEARWVKVEEMPDFALPAPHRKLAQRLCR